MTKPITEIFAGTRISIPVGAEALAVQNIRYDSRKIKKGDLFIAVKGFACDGHRYLAQAETSGAVAAVVERPAPELGIPQIVVEDTRKLMATLAYNFYRDDFAEMDLVGITGTNGKTTTSFLVRSILEAAGLKTGLIGTIAYYYQDKEIPAWNTTPEAIDIAELIHDMSVSGHQACVLEVSSHALFLNRVDRFPFRAGVFTNMSHDHLDFHKNFEDYFMTKAKLFTLLAENGRAIINMDDPYGERLAKLIKHPVIRFGFSETADLRAERWEMSAKGTQLVLKVGQESWQIESDLISLFNIQNMMAAVATGVALDVEYAAICEGIKKMKRVPGRLEKYEVRPGVLAVIDYAHTPDALEKAADALRHITRNRLTIVFGCGGDRDRAKRPVMGSIAERLADHVIVTSDNPRNEDPEAIINDILKGMNYPEKRDIIVDRREAIFQAIRKAGEGDIVLIAGKGHESYQIIKGQKIDFNEPALIKEASSHA